MGYTVQGLGTLPEGMAERVGFEPTLEFPLNTLSKRAPSATRPSLRERRFILNLPHGVAESGVWLLAQKRVRSSIAGQNETVYFRGEHHL